MRQGAIQQQRRRFDHVVDFHNDLMFCLPLLKLIGILAMAGMQVFGRETWKAS
jgi:hypothetical protein